MSKPRNPRSDSAAAAVQAAQNVALGPLAPPPHVELSGACKPFWTAIMRNRPRDRWNDADLAQAAVLARAQCDIERLQREIETEGDIIGDKPNPKHRIVEMLVKRASAVSRLIHVHTEATVGRVQNAGNAVERERQAEADHDPLIPTLRIVQ